MDTIKPIKINAKKANHAISTERLTSAEIGKLWATYMGNSMSKYVLQYFIKNCDDLDIKKTLVNALNLCEDFLRKITEIFEHDHIPVPYGFTEEDVNLGAPRLFLDEFYLHYLKYSGKAGISLYAIAIPWMTRLDVREFFTNVIDSTVRLLNQVNDLLLDKGLLVKVPNIPIQDKVQFVRDQSYLNGWFGDVRPLHSLEIFHLWDNIDSNATSKALLMGFSQVVKTDEVRKYLQKGKELTVKHMELCTHRLHSEDLPSPPLHDNLVTTSTFAPFSDKLILFHKIDMFSMRMRSYGNSASVNGRHDIGILYAKLLADISLYVNEGAKIYIDHGWMELSPQAADRDDLASK